MNMRSLFHRQSFRNIWFWTCIFIALLPVLLTGYFIVPFYNDYRNKQAVISGDARVQDAAAVLGEFFTSCDETCRKIARDAAAENVLVTHISDKLYEDLYRTLIKYASSLKCPAIISIYDVGGLRVFSTDESSVPPRLDRYSGLMPVVEKGSEVIYYSTGNPDNVTGEKIIEAAYPLENQHGMRMGILVMDFTTDSIRTLFTGFYGNGLDLILTDSSGTPVFCSSPDFSEEEQNAFLLDSAGTQKEFRNGYAGLWSPYDTHGYSLKARLLSPPVSPLLSAIQKMAILSAIFCLILVILMNGAMHSRIDTAVKEEKEFNATRLKLFQTQLNPHFLYNTLDTIKWNAKIHGLEENALLAENLAGILRQAISSNPFVTLEEELSLVRNYTEIQKIRFPGSFTYEEEVPDSLLKAQVPKLILQPLVENSILHGLEGVKDGYICVFAKTEKDKLFLSVYDNGKGLSPEMAERINHPAEINAENHLGLYNLSGIIRLYYGPDYGLFTVPSSGDGTTVRITLPYRVSPKQEASAGTDSAPAEKEQNTEEPRELPQEK